MRAAAAARGAARAWGALRTALRSVRLRLVMISGMFMWAGYDAISISIGMWLDDSFGLSVEGLGAASAVMGVGELCGVCAVTLASDRIGLRRAALGAELAAAAACLVLYLLGVVAGSLGPALLGVWLLWTCFEFTIVSILSLSLAACPEARGSAITLVFAAMGASRGVGAVVGEAVFNAAGIGGVALLSGLANAAAAIPIIYLGRLTREPAPPEPLPLATAAPAVPVASPPVAVVPAPELHRAPVL